MLMETIDEAIREFNVMLVNTCKRRGVRVMKFANCICYAFDDVGGLQIDEEHEKRIKRLAKETGYKTTIIDLTLCNTATSTAVGYWADIITQVKLNGGRVLMVAPNGYVLRSIKTVGLDKLCDFADDLERALASLNAKQSEAHE